MNGKCVAATVLLVAIVAIVDPIHADDIDVPVDGKCIFSLTTIENLPHKYDCTRFFTCFRGAPLPRQCPIISGQFRRYHFNPTTQECDFPENSGCTIESSDLSRGCKSSLQVNCGVTTDSPVDSEESSSSPSRPPLPSEPPTECPSRNGRWAVHLAHESNCTLFYKCDWGKKVLLSCPSELHFDRYLQVCNWPELARCNSTGSADATESTTADVTESTTAHATESTTADAIESTTATGVEGGDSDSTPGVESEPGTDGGTESDVTPSPPTASIPTECPRENGKYAVHIAHESNCNLFYKCNWGEKIELSCPSGLHFNPVLQVCDWPQHAGCAAYNPDADSDADNDCNPESGTTEDNSEVVTDAATTASTVTEDNCEEVTDAATTAPTSTEDNSEVATDAATTAPTVTEDNSEVVTDAATTAPTVTEDNSEVVTDAATTAPTVTEDNSEVVTDAATATPTVTEDNSEVVTDAATTAPTVGAQDDTETESTTEAVPEGNGDAGDNTGSCNNEDGTESSSCGTSSIPTECPSENGEYAVHIAHESDCSLFYTCNWGQAILTKCPGGLHFNPSLQVCDWPQSAGCTASGSDADSDAGSDADSDADCDPNSQPGTTEDNSGVVTDSTTAPTVGVQDDTETESATEAVPEGNGSSDDEDGTESSSSETPSIPTKCPSENGEYAVHIAHESDCSLFYTCNWGQAILTKCPGGLHFNPSLQVCDWPQSAGCTASGSDADSDAGSDADSDADSDAGSDADSDADCDPNSQPGTTEDNSGVVTDAATTASTVTEDNSEVVTDAATTTPTITEDNSEVVTDAATTASTVTEDNSEVVTDAATTASTVTEDNSEVITDAATTAPTGTEDNSEVVTDAATTASTVTEDNSEVVTDAATAAPTVTEDNSEVVTDATTATPTVTEDNSEVVTDAATTAPTVGAQDDTETESTTEAVPEGNGDAGDNTGSCNNEDGTESSSCGTSSIPTECPSENGEYAVHIAHESDCSLFYKCNWGQAILTKCPGGLHFNPSLQVCDWPQSAGCTASGSDADSDAGSDADSDADSDAGSDADSDADCDPNSQPGTTEDNSGVVTDSTTAPTVGVQDDTETESATEAVPEGNGSSDDEDGTESSSSETPSIPTKCPSENGEYAVHIAHESDCSLFYTCNWGQAILSKCPSGLHFNPSLQVCDWPQSAGCTASGSDADSDAGSDADSDSGSDADSDAGSDADSDAGSDADSDAGSDDDSDADSDADPGLESTVADSEPVTEQVTSETTVNVQPTESTTQAVNDNNCDDNNNVGTEIDEDEGNTGLCQGECPTVDPLEYTVLLPHQDVTKFCKCSNGTPYLYRCPPKLHFDNSLKVCNWPEAITDSVETESTTVNAYNAVAA